MKRKKSAVPAKQGSQSAILEVIRKRQSRIHRVIGNGQSFAGGGGQSMPSIVLGSNRARAVTGPVRSHRAVFLDRDGTIVYDRPGHYLTRLADLKLYRDTKPALRTLRDSGFLLIVVTNQSGIARGYLTRGMAEKINSRLKKILFRAGAPLDGIYYCPHAPKEKCNCRKPAPGLILKAARMHAIDLRRSFVMGDKLSDIRLGRRMGIKTVLLLTGHGKSQLARYKKNLKPDYTARGILQGARWIVKQQQIAYSK